MRPDWQVIVCGCLILGVAVIVALRELILLRRRASKGSDDGWGGPYPDRHPKPLPPCLLPPLHHIESRVETPQRVTESV